VASKFSQFMADNKLDQRRILAASRALEKLRPEDRRIRLEKRRGRKKEGGDPAAKNLTKPRSGRPVTTRLLNDIEAGKPVAGPAKTRLLRAVNRVLEQKKREPIQLKAIF
jgi:hypothetical protein